MRPLALTLAIALAAAFATPAAMAAPKPEPRAAVFQAVADCRKVTEDGARLACFDKAAAALDQAEANGHVVVIDREQVKTIRRQSFGFTLPAFTVFNRGPKEDRVEQVSIELAEAHQFDGKWIMTSIDGITWAQTDSEFVTEPPHKGSTVTVKNAALGSYLCKIDGQFAVRCQRQH